MTVMSNISGSLLYGANIQANGIRQHYLRYGGKGRPLVILPGITSPAVTWGFIAEPLAANHDVYVLDVRGRGLSQADADLDYSLDAMAEDASAFIKALNLKDALVLGHSMGARIAMRAKTQYGLDAAGYILADPPVCGPDRRPYPMKIDWYVDSIRLAVKGMSAEDMRPFCPTWTDEQLTLRAQWLHTCLESAIVDAYNGFHEDDIFPDFAQMPKGTMLMVAGQGGVIQPEDVAEIQGLNNGIEISYVPDAGHMIPWGDLPTFLKQVQSYSAALPASQTGEKAS